MRYTPEQKAEALARAAEIGVAKASEELSISTQTLYAWQRQAAADNAPEDAVLELEELKAILLEDHSRIEKRLAEVEAENADLRKTNAKLKNMLVAFVKSV